MTTQVNWISVFDRLPGYGDRILCFARHQGGISEGYRQSTSASGEKWIRGDGYGHDGPRYEPTHWAPMPEEPE